MAITFRSDKLFWEDTSKPPLPGGAAFCLMCAAPFVMPMYKGGIADQICEECSKTYKDCAIVVCKTCPGRPVICRIVPKKLDNGYYVRPRAVLHSDYCNVCKPGLKTSTVLEIEAWERTQRPSKPVVIVSK
jgi:hypothetical protein